MDKQQKIDRIIQEANAICNNNVEAKKILGAAYSRMRTKQRKNTTSTEIPENVQ